MLLDQTKNKKLEEDIVEALHIKSQDGPTLLKLLSNNDSSVSKETFYRIIRKLINTEVLTKQKSLYEINRHWLQKIYRFSKKYVESNEEIGQTNIVSFSEGDKVSYKFKNPNLMGIYWAHTYDIVFERHDKNIPILIHHAHEWLIHVRKNSETFFLNRFSSDEKLAWFNIACNTKLDKEFKRENTSKYLQINTGKSYSIKNTEYINVLGGFIFKIQTSTKFADELENFFQTNKEVNKENILELEKICNKNNPTKMTITRSAKEASKLYSKFKKDFYLLNN